MEETMHAWGLHNFGSPDSFVKERGKRPTLVQGELLVKVKATSVNSVDYVIRSGARPEFIDGLPAILHSDVAGIVVETGKGVRKFKEGDHIYACAGGFADIPGALADYMLVDERLASLKPENLSFAQSAALPLVAITAWEGLIEKVRISKDQTVLVHGATGGVGHIGVQLANWKQTNVYVTGSTPEKMEIGLELGADHAINYRKETVEEYVETYTDGYGFDVVFDTIGGENLVRSFKAARLNGTVVTPMAGQIPRSEIIHKKGLSLHSIMMPIPLVHNIDRRRHGEILRQIKRLVETEVVKPLIDSQQFIYDEIAEARRRAESGQQVGKVVLSR